VEQQRCESMSLVKCWEVMAI